MSVYYAKYKLTFGRINCKITIIKKTINIDVNIREINNTVLIHNFIISLCKASNPRDGIRFPQEYLKLINAVKQFNYNNIYYHPRLDNFKKYARLIIESIFDTLLSFYKGHKTLEEIERNERVYPVLIQNFKDWMIKYSAIDTKKRIQNKYGNMIIYDNNSKDDYTKAILDFISGMTDSFAIRVFMELTSL